MKTATPFLAIAAVIALSSCATAPDGSKTFLGLSAPQWAGVGKDATQAAAASFTAQKNAKNPVQVQP